jgi:hypothetical protein
VEAIELILILFLILLLILLLFESSVKRFDGFDG